MSKRYPPEVRKKALRLSLDHLDEYPSTYAGAQAIGPMVDVHPEFDAGATEVVLTTTDLTSPADHHRTIALLGELARR
ncbi:hypothetical protein [Nocardia fluminea]|uniref:hypothetical protein n=1 Tax=Nocardia fluminea TaxID=134984 RepID=UPI00365EF277